MVKKQVQISIPGELKDEPFFYNIIKNFDVVVKITEASFSTDTGWAIVHFEAEEKEYDRLLEYFAEKGIKISPL